MADATVGSSVQLVRRSAPWLRVWTRAVIGPAVRRASGVWVGLALIAAIIFGPTGIKAHDLTTMALTDPGVGAVMVGVWLLLFVPIARIVLRAEAARYLLALPGPTGAAAVLAALALVGLQLPWCALWLIGEGVRGVPVLAVVTAVATAIAWWRPPVARVRTPRWRSASHALRAVYARALRRRAGDALVRAGGLAILAGLAAALLVRNNELVGADAATTGAAVITLAVVPAQVGVLATLVDAYRQTGWLAASLGVTPAARVGSLAATIVVVYVIGTAIAVGTVGLVVGDAATTAWVGATALGTALGSGLLATRVLLWAERAESSASRTVVGAVVTAAVAMLWLGMFGVAGVVGTLATAMLALSTLPPLERET